MDEIKCEHSMGPSGLIELNVKGEVKTYCKGYLVTTDDSVFYDNECKNCDHRFGYYAKHDDSFGDAR